MVKPFNLLMQNPVHRSKAPRRLIVDETFAASLKASQWYSIPENAAHRKELQAKRLREHRDEINEARRLARKANPEKFRKKAKRYYATHADARKKNKARAAKRYKEKRDEILAKKSAKQKAAPKKLYLDTCICPRTGQTFTTKRQPAKAGMLVYTPCKACGSNHRLVAGPIPIEAFTQEQRK